MFSKKELSKEEYNAFKKEYKAAGSAIDNRAQKVKFLKVLYAFFFRF